MKKGGVEVFPTRRSSATRERSGVGESSLTQKGIPGGGKKLPCGLKKHPGPTHSVLEELGTS